MARSSRLARMITVRDARLQRHPLRRPRIYRMLGHWRRNAVRKAG